ncbi:MAG: YunC family protein [Planctomycetota bacterium]
MSNHGPKMNLRDFEVTRHELKRPLLVISGTKGVLACGYLNVETFNKLDEAGAIVTGVDSFEAMLDASLIAVSKAARELGLAEGMTGRQALERFR